MVKTALVLRSQPQIYQSCLQYVIWVGNSFCSYSPRKSVFPKCRTKSDCQISRNNCSVPNPYPVTVSTDIYTPWPTNCDAESACSFTSCLWKFSLMFKAKSFYIHNTLFENFYEFSISYLKLMLFLFFIMFLYLCGKAYRFEFLNTKWLLLLLI